MVSLARASVLRSATAGSPSSVARGNFAEEEEEETEPEGGAVSDLEELITDMTETIHIIYTDSSWPKGTIDRNAENDIIYTSFRYAFNYRVSREPGYIGIIFFALRSLMIDLCLTFD